MSSKRKKKKTDKNDIEMWTEEQYEQYMKGLFGLNFIVGYTEEGVPYGIPLDADNEWIKRDGSSRSKKSTGLNR